MLHNSSSVNLDDLVDYVFNHPKKSKVFKGWTKEQLKYAIGKGISDVCCAWSEDENGKINGMVLVEPSSFERKVLYVVGIIADEAYVMRGFLELLFSLYPGWIVSGRRHGTQRIYNKNFLARLWNKKS